MNVERKWMILEILRKHMLKIRLRVLMRGKLAMVLCRMRIERNFIES